MTYTFRCCCCSNFPCKIYVRKFNVNRTTIKMSSFSLFLVLDSAWSAFFTVIRNLVHVRTQVYVFSSWMGTLRVANRTGPKVFEIRTVRLDSVVNWSVGSFDENIMAVEFVSEKSVAHVRPRIIRTTERPFTGVVSPGPVCFFCRVPSGTR